MSDKVTQLVFEQHRGQSQFTYFLLGVAASATDVVTAAQATARVLLEEHGAGARVLLLGGEGLRAALAEEGLVALDEPDGAVAVVSGYGADVLFEGLARAYAERAIACVLSGNGNDGTEGVKAIRAAGGFVIAESESTAAYADMAASAVATRKVDLVLPIEEIGFALEVLVRGEALRAA